MTERPSRSTEPTNGIIHEVARGAGSDGAQRCILCGAVIWDQTDVMEVEGDTINADGWAPGPITVITRGVMTITVPGARSGAYPCLFLDPTAGDDD